MRQALRTDGNSVLPGESSSGPLALTIAAAPPPRLRGLIRSTTFARSPRAPGRRSECGVAQDACRA
ncbi:MAG TPA: hypothetical protein DCM50_09035 [Stenotrophomonas sp.]|nr:hypothetical protein [Stenotrophomonas sp.]HCV96344.1 hypothetical protein [Stenotrophomonas sp.]